MSNLPLKMTSRLLLASVASLSLAWPALAQDARGTATDATKSSEEIVVTAQKRSERLIDTPQSVTAISAKDLAKLSATQFADFANTVPGLQFTTQGPGKTAINLRGVTTGVDVAQTVGIYVDDVPYGSSGAFANAAQLALDVGLFDLDRVEVLRGPQGTLYGASSMGGVLKYVTNAPSLSSFGGSAQAGVSGTHDGGTNYNGAAVVNIPIVEDKIALRASGYYARNGGYVDNVATGQKDVDSGRIYGTRLDLLIKPVDDLSIRITGFGQNIHRNGSLYSSYTLSGVPVDGSLDQTHPLPELYNSGFRLISGNISYDFGGATLTSISSYQTLRVNQLNDASQLYGPLLGLLGVPGVAAVGFGNITSTKKFTEEARLASSTGRKLEWLLGAFYTHEKSDNLQWADIYGPGKVLLPINLVTAQLPSLYQEYAVFGDLTYHLTDKFDVTGGVRYAHSNQAFEQIATGLVVGSQPKAYAHDGVVTYLANARYHFDRDVTAYARFATGYRPGGPNFKAIDPATGQLLAPTTFKSDTLNSYELGFKAQTADRSFSIDASVYYIDWKNIQVATAANGISVEANAGNAHIKGAELTLVARPDRGTTISGAFAYNDGYLTADNPALGATRGERLPNAAHFTATLNADYVLASSPLKPTAGATLRYVSDRAASFDHNAAVPQYRLPAYTTIDLRVGLSLGPVDGQVFVHNLFDVRGQLSALTFVSALGGPAQITILQPRTIGLSLTTHF
jgi:outer membrane receptor protein involved in Fe transport